MISVCTGVRVSRPVYRDHAPLFWSQFTPVQSTTHTSQHCCSLYHRDHSHPHRDHPQDLWQYLSIPQLSSLWSWAWAVLILTTVFVLFTKSSLRKWFVSRTTFPHFPTSENRSCSGVDGSVWTVGAGIVVVSDQRRECSQFSHTSGQSSPGCF